MEDDKFLETFESLIKTLKDLIVKPVKRFTGFASLGLLLIVLLLTALVFFIYGCTENYARFGCPYRSKSNRICLISIRYSFFSFIIKQLQKEEKKCMK